MDLGGTAMIFLMLASLFCAYLFFSLTKFLHKVCWTPLRVQRIMRSQGISGPSYRLLYGNSKEILNVKKQSFGKPMEVLDHRIGPNVQPHIWSWINKYGEPFVYWNGPNAEFVTTDLEIVREVMNDKDSAYPKTDVEGYFKILLGDGLVTSKGKKWVSQRKLANHVFHAESLRNMTPAMVASVETMLEKWKQHEEKEIEVFEEFKLLTSEIISRTAFGSSYVEGEHIFQMLRKLTFLIARNSHKVRLPVLKTLFKSPDDIEADTIDQGIRESVIDIINKREKNAGGKVDSFGNDFLGLLMKANHSADESYKITIEDIVDECKTFYLAGHETTTSLLAWSVFVLAVHTDWQEKAREEVSRLFGGQQPKSDGLSRMKTMNMIINETLRLYPPVLALVRKSQHEVNLGKFKVPGNTRFLIPVLPIHHDTQIWGEDAHLFKPERFSEGVAKATKNNPTVFLPFGLGPRSCVGLNFATNEAKIALSMILQRYAFTLSPSYCHAPYVVLTTCPKSGVQIFLHPL